MKKLFVLISSLLLMTISGCFLDDEPSHSLPGAPAENLISAKAITAFSINGTEGVIDETAKTITVSMPFTDLTALVATFTTTGASVTVGSIVQTSGTTANNFNSPVVYTVKAEDGTTQDYTVNIIELGRYQVFESYASNLDANYTANTYNQVYVHDLRTGTTSLVSVGIDGNPADGDCYGAERPTISADGRYVAFDSNATNLVNVEFQGNRQVYLRDLQTKTTTLISLGSDSKMGDYCSKEPIISADGKYIVYTSNASNILDGVAASSQRQIFLYEMGTGTTTLVSVGYDGNPGDSCSRRAVISADGKFVAFESKSTNIVNGVDPADVYQIFIRNLGTGVTSLVSVGTDGSPANGTCYGTQRPTISADGRYVAFDSNATNLVDMEFQGSRQVYIRDLQTNTTILVSKGYDGLMADYCSKDSRISADGSYIVYSSNASNILENTAETSKRQIFLFEKATGTTTLVSVGSDGNAGDSCSRFPLISVDGRYVTFDSDATNMVNGVDAGGYSQVYIRDMVSKTTSMISVSSSGAVGDGNSYLQYNNY